MDDMMPDMVSATDTVDASTLIKAAQAAVRAYCGWHVAPIFTHSITVDAWGGRRLMLPTLRLLEFKSLKWDGVEHADDCRWSVNGSLQLTDGLQFPDEPGAVTATITDGWDLTDVPQVQAVIMSAARRAQIQPGVASQSVNGSSVTYLAGVQGVALAQSEKQLLEPYRIEGSV